MDSPEIRREVVLTPPAHQVWLSFTDDSDAEVFEAWWTDEGEEMFVEWAREYYQS